jgi:hypothetical protein
VYLQENTHSLVASVNSGKRSSFATDEWVSSELVRTRYILSTIPPRGGGENELLMRRLLQDLVDPTVLLIRENIPSCDALFDPLGLIDDIPLFNDLIPLSIGRPTRKRNRKGCQFELSILFFAFLEQHVFVQDPPSGPRCNLENRANRRLQSI